MIDQKMCAHNPYAPRITKVLLCGPPNMVKAMVGHLTEFDWPEPSVVSKIDDPIFKF